MHQLGGPHEDIENKDRDHHGPHQLGNAAKGGSPESADPDLTDLAQFVIYRDGGTLWDYIDRLCQTEPVQCVFK